TDYGRHLLKSTTGQLNGKVCRRSISSGKKTSPLLLPSTPPGMLPAGCRLCRCASCGACLLSVSPAACVCRDLESIWRGRPRPRLGSEIKGRELTQNRDVGWFPRQKRDLNDSRGRGRPRHTSFVVQP